MFGVDGANLAADSRRLSGSAWRLGATKRILLQRDPLSVRQYRIFCDGVWDADSPQDKVLCGHILFCVGARARGADAQAALSEPVLDLASDRSFGFVESSATDLKTTNTLAKR